MPNRIVREGIISSEAVDQLTWTEEVFYRRLHSVVDDYGRYHANPSLLRAACFPLRLDKVSDSDIGKWLLATEKAGLVRVYQVEGRRFLEVVKFGQHARAKSSKFPQPPPICSAEEVHMQCTRTAYAPVVVVEGEGGGDASKRASRLPPDWSPTEPLKAWAEKERPDLDITITEAKFRDYWTAKPGRAGTKLDWDATFRNWVRDEKQGRAMPQKIKVDL